MHDIRFRAWDKSRKMIIKWEQLLVEDTRRGEYLHRALTDNNYTLMQFTGLHDKNGVEIYEGDIVNHGDNYPSEIVFDNYQWELREWGYEKEGYKYRTHDLLSYTNPIEVIGNVFENPELAGRTE